LVTGRPGTGKTSLAYRVAYELGLGEVLEWPITTRTMLKDGLYQYDAIGRAQEQDGSLADIGDYIRLGPLGTALIPCDRPRVLLIDEIDKSDIDLPNDLLNIFEEGRFEIPELSRIKDKQVNGIQMSQVRVKTAYTDESEPSFEKDSHYDLPKGQVSCTAFPLVIMTSNGEREFPAPFLRRCLRLTMEKHGKSELEEIVQRHLGDQIDKGKVDELISAFLKKRDQEEKDLATDQLLNAVYLTTANRAPDADTRDKLIELLLSALNE
jgi:MoxR-like ATPase